MQDCSFEDRMVTAVFLWGLGASPAKAALWVQQDVAHLALQPLTHPQPLLLLLPPHNQVRHDLVQDL